MIVRKLNPRYPNEVAQSNALVRIVGVFYALVLGQAIYSKGQIFEDPERTAYTVAAVALLVVFSGAAWQYLRLVLNLGRTPYDVIWTRNSNELVTTPTEEVRFGADLGLAAGYAFLLVQALRLIHHPRTNLLSFLATLCAIGVLDFLSSTVLTRHHWNLGQIRCWYVWSRALLLGPILLTLIYGLTAGTRPRDGFNLTVLIITGVLVNGRELVERHAAAEVWRHAPEPRRCACCGQLAANSADSAPPLQPETEATEHEPQPLVPLNSEEGADRPGVVRAYLAGPEVFLRNARDVGEKKKSICARYGIEGVFPLDILPSKEALERDEPLAIYQVCVDLMGSCDIIIANMTPFRGVSMDVGTAIEMGYMRGARKKVFGYTNSTNDYRTRVRRSKRSGGMQVENFGLSDNLMCDGVVRASGSSPVRHKAGRRSRFVDLAAFEECVRFAAESAIQAQ